MVLMVYRVPFRVYTELITVSRFTLNACIKARIQYLLRGHICYKILFIFLSNPNQTGNLGTLQYIMTINQRNSPTDEELVPP